MARETVRIVNNNTEDYTEIFREQKITIPAGKSVIMSRHEANMFLGQYSGTGPGGIPKTKMLVILPLDGQDEESLSCNRCGKCFGSKETLDEHLKIHKDEVYIDKRIEENKTGGFVTQTELDAKLGSLQKNILEAIKGTPKRKYKKKVLNDSNANIQ